MSDRKYRFDDLIGNSVNVGLLRKSIDRKTFKPFTIFSGVLGTGKSTCARIAAMALTCESPAGGKPCLKCSSCMGNISAFDSAHESMWVKIINAGKLVNRGDVAKVIHEMFDLQGGLHNRVFIVEEAHALNGISGAETAFLTEIDQMPSNTYVIMCTTKISDIIDELQSRAVIYNFGRLTDNEARLLLDYEMRSKGVSLPRTISDLILQNSRGVPRRIINSLEYVVDNDVTEDELKVFLQVIDNAALLQLFKSMQSEEISLCSENIRTLFASNEPYAVLDAIKNYVVKVVFLIEGGINEEFDSVEKREIQQIFSSEVLQKIVVLLDRSSYRLSEADLQMLLLRIRALIQHKSVTDAAINTKRVGKTEKIHAQKLQSELEEGKVGEIQLKKLSLNKVTSF